VVRGAEAIRDAVLPAVPHQYEVNLPKRLVAMGTAIHLVSVDRYLTGLPVRTLYRPRDHVLQAAEDRVSRARLLGQPVAIVALH